MKEAREARGLKLEDVARAMGLTPQALSQIENGTTKNPRLEHFLRFCAEFSEDPFVLGLGRSASSVTGALRGLKRKPKPDETPPK